MKTSDNQKEEFLELLRSTGRDGVEDLIGELETNGFFTAPASAGHHLNKEGGLLEHSLNTCKVGLQIWEDMKVLDPTLERVVERENVIIASLLHDVCKSDIYVRTVKKRKNYLGQWEDSEGYKLSYKNMPLGHGEKSVVMLLCYGLELMEPEMLAIRWHMGPFEINFNSYDAQQNYNAANKMHPLVTIIRCADGLAANVMERDVADLDEL